MRLSAYTTALLPADVARPGYDRQAQQVGIVHLGLGAFHRAHQAVYTDDAMSQGDRDWSIAGVSLRSSQVRNELTPQDGLYTVIARDGSTESVRLVGAIAAIHVANEAPEAVIAHIAAATTRIVTLSITEKGYYRRADGSLDSQGPDIAEELADGHPRTIYGFLRAGLSRRRQEARPGLTLISCDNMQENGRVLTALLSDFLDRCDPALAEWFRQECACPSTMVDRIVPAVTAQVRADIESRLGMRDEACVATEPFRQWVIEDRFAGPRPRWEAGGAELVADVRPYEIGKLRILNGAHSALAYLGLEKGHRFVHEAIGDASIRVVVERLMREEAAGSFSPARGQNLDAYCDALLDRFGNHALNHRLLQIAMDGSQKIPQRWLGTLSDHQHQRRRCPGLLTALAAWIVHVRGTGHPVSDPAASELAALWSHHGRNGIVQALFGPGGRFASAWVASPADALELDAAISARGG